MEINKFNYFANQQVGNSNPVNGNVQDFDLDLQTVNQGGEDPIVQGSGHWWCHPTQESWCQTLGGCSANCVPTIHC